MEDLKSWFIGVAIIVGIIVLAKMYLKAAKKNRRKIPSELPNSMSRAVNPYRTGKNAY